jgi:hypothetical protein
MRKIGILFGALLVVSAAAACIKRESVVTWYVDPSGSVTWSVLERDIRSDADDRTERHNEEESFLTLAKSREHPAGTGLTRVAGIGVKSTIIKDKAPFVVLTEAQFSGLDQLGRRFMSAYRLSGTSLVTHEGDAWIWTLTIDEVPEDGDGGDDDKSAWELEAILGDKLQVALREGRFTKAKGFSINDDGRIATLSKDIFDADIKQNGPITLQLVWEID